MKMNNKGYSMVEMIIVVAIIAILSGMSMVTMNVVYTAKANSAVNTFRTQVSTLKTVTEAQSAKTAAMLYYNETEKQYYVQFGTNDSSGYTPDASKEEVVLPDRVAIYYTPSGGAEMLVGTQTSNEGVLIQFNKSDGTVLCGAGTFRFVKANNKQIYNTVTGASTGPIGSTVDTLKLIKNSGNLTR